MKRLGLNLTAALLCFAAGLLAAASQDFVAPRQGAGFHHAPAAPLAALTLRPETNVLYLPESPIRRVDFLNFTYPNDGGPLDPKNLRTFRLIHGRLDAPENYDRGNSSISITRT
jgi:hypothetical protein